MLPKNAIEKIQANVSKPCFWKSLSPGQTWKSKSMLPLWVLLRRRFRLPLAHNVISFSLMFPLLNVSIVLLISGFIKRIIPEDFVRRTRGAFEHRVVFSVRWENSWQLWLEREKNELFMIEEDWNEFVDDNHLGPNDNLFIKHDETMNLEVQIFKNNGVEIIDVPLGVEPETEPFHPTPKKPHKETTPASSFASGSRCSANGGTNGRAKQRSSDVKNPERYLLNPENPYFVQAVTKRNDVLYVSRPVVQSYRLKFGPVKSTITYLLPGEKKEEGENRIYNGKPCFSGWSVLCRRHNLNIGDSVVCELERSGGVVTAVRVHFVKKD
ncbi:B3 DNA binding domain [Arabidopsis thaliana x Arabidopsis arenosa]|uniref:B3 DNA binding domain n=1 Tax=Arabidopsis thaliana x Arabidopsis arenosa TaxID=1240361 RepID=A0A8T2CVI0_9BRAS|nr:B3 DNA binding domain [Arabidopsis thaliana x Arabidopsis arenosa]